MDSHQADALAAPQFVFVTCQVGAERALKSEVARRWPAFHFAYSRPGFLTFKLPPGFQPPDDFDLDLVFARSWGFSLGKLDDAELFKRAAGVWRLAHGRRFDALHVWQRDTAKPGWRGFEPGVTDAARAAQAEIEQARPAALRKQAPLPSLAEIGQTVLDCVLVEPDQWWVGWHRARGDASRYPGGLNELTLPTTAVSRAYLKMVEALDWSGLPLERGQTVAELGCAPGGASQALLARGLRVIGVDPAEVDPVVLADERFTHIRKRATDVRRREFRGVTWLAADMNVAPETTMDAVEGIVTHEAVNIRGLLLTLKLLEWEMADLLPEYLQRIRSWGYRDVRARQLTTNRQDVCVAALRSKSKSRRVKAKRGAKRSK